MTPKQLAEFLQVSPATLRRQMGRGQIPFVRVGNQYRFIPSEVLQKLREKK